MGTLSGMPTWDARIKQREATGRAARCESVPARGVASAALRCACAGEAEAGRKFQSGGPRGGGDGGAPAGAVACGKGRRGRCGAAASHLGVRRAGFQGADTWPASPHAPHVGPSRSKLGAIPVRFRDTATPTNTVIKFFFSKKVIFF